MCGKFSTILFTSQVFNTHCDCAMCMFSAHFSVTSFPYVLHVFHIWQVCHKCSACATVVLQTSGTPLLWTLWGTLKCPDFQGHNWNGDTHGIFVSVLNSGMSSFQGVHSEGSSFQGSPQWGVLISGVSIVTGSTVILHTLRFQSISSYGLWFTLLLSDNHGCSACV